MIDLEKARATYSAGCAEDAANLVPDLIAEIERVRADNAGLSKAVISIQEERDLAQAEFRAYHKAWEDQAAETERLRAELAKVNRAREAEIDQAGAAERMYLDGVRAKDARIQELEQYNAWLKADREFAYDELTAKMTELNADHQYPPESKRSWQITEERKAAIQMGLDYLEYAYAKSGRGDIHEHAGQLRAMLEAGQ